MFRRVLVAACGFWLLLAASDASAQSESANAQRQSALIKQMKRDAQAGYRYLTIKDYSQTASQIPVGTKIAIPAHIQSQILLTDLTKRYQANVVITKGSAEGRQKFLDCFKARTRITGWPCPTVVLGITAVCDRTSFGIEDGTIPCIVMNDAWSFYDIADVWTENEVWNLRPVEGLIQSLR